MADRIDVAVFKRGRKLYRVRAFLAPEGFSNFGQILEETYASTAKAANRLARQMGERFNVTPSLVKDDYS